MQPSDSTPIHSRQTARKLSQVFGSVLITTCVPSLVTRWPSLLRARIMDCNTLCTSWQRIRNRWNSASCIRQISQMAWLIRSWRDTWNRKKTFVSYTSKRIQRSPGRELPQSRDNPISTGEGLPPQKYRREILGSCTVDTLEDSFPMILVRFSPQSKPYFHTLGCPWTYYRIGITKFVNLLWKLW